MQLAVILPAAGASRRFGSSDPAAGKSKLEMEIAGRAVLHRSVELFTKRSVVKQIIVAVNPDEIDAFKFKWSDRLGLLGVKVVPGGKVERWETVLNALKAVDPGITHVAVHDAARPVAAADMIDRVLEAAAHYPAVIPAVPVHATVKKLEDQPLPDPSGADPLDRILGSAGKKTVEARKVSATVPRAGLWLAQTPQVFTIDLIRKAYEQIAAGKLKPDQITDDAGLVEVMGHPVAAVMGDEFNVKITLPADLKFAEAVLMMRSGKIEADKLGAKRQHPTWAQMDDE